MSGYSDLLHGKVSETSETGSDSTSEAYDGRCSTDAGLNRADYLCLASLFGLVLLVYAQLWIPGLVLIKRDAFQLFLPLKQYIIERLSAGELPQWFPYEGLGRPLISLTVMGVFHPFTALYWLFPVHDAYRISTLVSCFMGAAGAFLLGRALGISPAGSMIGSLGFSCSGYVMSLTENLVYLYSTCALPLFLFALEKMLITQRHTWLGCSALIWASVFLNGDIQTGYYYGFVVMVWTALRARGPRWQAMYKIVLLASLAFLLASIQLAPAWVSYAKSERTESASFHAEAIHWSTHPLRLATLVISPIGDSVEGDRIAEGIFQNSKLGRGPAGFWAESLYLGLPIIGLAALGFWRRRDLLIFMVIGVGGILLAMGAYGGLYEILYQWVPLWSSFRYPEKFMGMASFALAMLAGGTFDVMREGRSFTLVWCAIAVLFFGLGALLLTESTIHLVSETFHIPSQLARHIAHSTASASLFSAAAALGMGLITGWVTMYPSQHVWASTAVVLLVVVDLARASLPAVQTTSSEAWTFTPGLASAIEKDARVKGPGHFRILSIKDAVANVSEAVDKVLTSRERIAIIRRQGLYLEHNAVSHIESIQNYLAGYSPAAERIGRSASLQTAARYNVAYFIGRPSRFDTPSFAHSLVATVPDYDLALVRNPSPVTPRAYLSRRPEVLSSTMRILSFLEREDFLTGEVDGIESASLPFPGPLQDGKATILEYRPEFVRVAVETPQPAVLVLADAFEPGWKARTGGGNDLQVFRANGLVRAVLVPAGQFEVEFSYETPFLRIGAWLTLLGLGITVSLIAKEWGTKRAYPKVQPLCIKM